VPLSVPPPVGLMVLTNCLASLQPPRGTRRTRKSLPAPQTYRRFGCEIGPRMGISARDAVNFAAQRSRTKLSFVARIVFRNSCAFRRSRHGNFSDEGNVSSKLRASPGMINGHVPRAIASFSDRSASTDTRAGSTSLADAFRFDFLRSASQS